MPPRTAKNPYTSPAAFLGEQLGVARVAAGYPTHDAMAKAIGTDRSTITKAENGDRPPTATVLEQVLDTCGITGQLRKVFEGLALLARVKEDGPVKIWFAGGLTPRESPTRCGSGSRSSFPDCSRRRPTPARSSGRWG